MALSAGRRPTLRTFNDADNTRNSNLTHSGKYTAPMGKGHLQAVGWDLEGARLSQVHVAEDDGGALFEDSGANLEASTRRLALFAQDEWDITERRSIYLGLRWEGIRTTSSGTGSEVKNTSRVWRPVLHTVWRIPGFEKDQVRASQGLRYLSSPQNIGSARTSGIELEAKFQLAELLPNSPDIDFRSSYSRFWSHVEGIPGPNNRLDGQAEQTANVGLDYRMKGRPLTLGASYNWTPSVLVQTSVTEASLAGVKRQVDLYGLWKFSAATQLRLSVNNLLAEDYVTARYLSAPAGYVATNAHTDPTLGLRFEMKL